MGDHIFSSTDFIAPPASQQDDQPSHFPIERKNIIGRVGYTIIVIVKVTKIDKSLRNDSLSIFAIFRYIRSQPFS